MSMDEQSKKFFESLIIFLDYHNITYFVDEKTNAIHVTDEKISSEALINVFDNLYLACFINNDENSKESQNLDNHTIVN